MISKKYIFIIFLFIMLIYLNGVCASDNMTSDIENIASDDASGIEIRDSEYYDEVNDQYVYGETEITKNYTIADFDCCSFIIQEDGETVYAFRQDSPLNGYGVYVHSENWNGVKIIKQELDTVSTYFFHSIITEDGWVMGQGGSQYDSSSRRIEQYASTMYVNKDISVDYLNRIKNVLSSYAYGHFVIKDPQGNYGIAFADRVVTGKLNIGQYMTIPNEIEYFDKGDYKKYSNNPVDAIIMVCSYDDSGLNRRNLYTYDYKAHDTENGVFYGIDMFVTNDNGHNVGLRTEKIVTHFYYEGTYYPASVVPQNPDKLYFGTKIFDNQYLGNVIDIDSSNLATVGYEKELHYTVNHLVAERTIAFELGENIDFVSANPTVGKYSYDSQNHMLYWTVPATKQAREITFKVMPKVTGNYNIHSYVISMDEDNDFAFNAIEPGAYLNANDVEKYVGGPQNLNIYLTDEYGNPLTGEKVSISINGQNYSRKITNNGYVSLAINLGAGEYDAKVSYDGGVRKNQTNVKVKVKTTLSGNDIVKYYKNDTQFYASFLDNEGNPLKNSDVQFNINGIFYIRKTNENGMAKLNINLNPNNYIITSINLATGERFANTITVKPVIIENKDLKMYYKDGSQFTVKVLDGYGNPLVGAKVTFNINGVFYERTTNENATAKLNINLAPGNYIITSTYNGGSVSNSIVVQERLVSSDLTMKYDDRSAFKVTVLDKGGNPSSEGGVVVFNINGIFYNRTIGTDGIAKLNINLLSGKYIITSYWNGYAKSNTITIKD